MQSNSYLWYLDISPWYSSEDIFKTFVIWLLFLLISFRKLPITGPPSSTTPIFPPWKNTGALKWRVICAKLHTPTKSTKMSRFISYKVTQTTQYVFLYSKQGKERTYLAHFFMHDWLASTYRPHIRSSKVLLLFFVKRRDRPADLGVTVKKGAR